MNNLVWIRVDLINRESYIGSIDTVYGDDEEDLLAFMEEQSYFGLKLDNVHRCFEENGKLSVSPIDEKESIYKSSMLIMNIDNILTLKFIKEDSDIIKQLKVKDTTTIISSSKKPDNVLSFKLKKKEQF